MSSLAIERCNLTIVGAWNPAIVTPNWLKEQFPELITRTDYQASYIPGPSPRVRFSLEGIEIDPNNGRLRLHPIVPEISRLDLIRRLAGAICDKLPHTPVRAVGWNFFYRLESTERPAIFRFVDNEGQERFYAGLDLKQVPQRHVRHSFALPECKLNIFYDVRSDLETIAFNFSHTAMRPSQIQSAIEGYQLYFDRTATFMNRLIEKESA